MRTLKTYIEIYQKTGFIQLFKSLINAFILFNLKSEGNSYLYINDQDFNNLTIKNWYPLPQIDKLLNWLSKDK